jgi:hypothetical protein
VQLTSIIAGPGAEERKQQDPIHSRCSLQLLSSSAFPTRRLLEKEYIKLK